MPICFDLTPEQEALRKLAMDFAQKEIAPRAAEIDEKEEIPRDIVEKIRKPPYRFTAVWIPKKYGGLELDKVSICLLLEEIGYASGSCITLIEVAGLGSLPIVFGGTEKQKAKYLTAIGLGEAYPAFALTERVAGTDAGAIKLRAERAGDEYVLNGRKRLVSNADLATFFTVFAKTDPLKGTRGISAFIVDKGTPGLAVGRRERSMGIKGHKSYELIFKNCKVPKESLLGEENRGFRLAMMTLDDTRLTLAAGNVGIARAALDAAVNFAKKREVFGKPIAEFQGIRFPLAEIAMETEAARLLALRAAWLADRGIRHAKETSMAKLYATELAVKASRTAMNVLGGFGATLEYPVERYLRDALTFIPAQGTSEVQKLVISRDLFK